MTRYELENKIYECNAAIDEDFTSLKTQVASLKHTVEKDKNLSTLLKITDLVKHIQSNYDLLDGYAMEDPDDEDGGMGGGYLDY